MRSSTCTRTRIGRKYKISFLRFTSGFLLVLFSGFFIILPFVADTDVSQLRYLYEAVIHYLGGRCAVPLASSSDGSLKPVSAMCTKVAQQPGYTMAYPWLQFTDLASEHILSFKNQQWFLTLDRCLERQTLWRI